jgi:hypothetical protein
MLIEHALKSYLEDQVALAALLGDGKLYYGTAPQDVTAPYVTISKVSSPRKHSHQGSSHLAKSRIQFSIFGAENESGYNSCKAIAAQLQVALQGKTGNIGDSPGVEIYSSLYDDETDGYDNGFLTLVVDYMIQHYD